MIRFSVIIPLYNKANFVKKTIESILSQTFKDFEIVVVNDGSTDNSLAVVSEITDFRIRIFTKENGGVSAARNFGIEKAQYEYIAFLDADDIWLPDYLETIKGMIEHYPQAGVFSTAYTYVDGKDGCKGMNVEAAKEAIYAENYCKSIEQKEIKQLWTGAICVKKDLFDKTGGFRVGVKRGEDLDMWLRLSLVSPIVWKNEPKVLYNRITENNARTTYNSYKESFPYWEWYSYSDSAYVKKYTTRLIIAMMKSCYRHKKYKDMLYLLFKIKWMYY
jgi:glycosyltransferase involved in cell wall biosynthesis